MFASWRVALLVVPFGLACSPVERNFTTGSGGGGHSTASHMGGGSSHVGGGGGAGPGAGAGSSTGGNGGSGITEAQACAKYAETICAQDVACAPDVLTYTYGDVTECQARTTIFCMSIIEAPDDAWTPGQFAECADALAPPLSCHDYLISPFTGGPSVCHPKAGKLANTKSCIDAAQCTSAYCKHVDGTACGKCAELAANGSACDTPFDCISGACEGMTGSKTCVKAKGKNDPCVGDGDCGFGFACQNGQCEEALNEGDPCDPNTLCDPLQGLYCNTDSNLCARASYVDAGHLCGASSPPDGGTPGLVGCTRAARCTNVPGEGLACVAPAADGAACDLSQGIGCTSPALCTNMKCLLPSQSNCN